MTDESTNHILIYYGRDQFGEKSVPVGFQEVLDKTSSSLANALSGVRNGKQWQLYVFFTEGVIIKLIQAKMYVKVCHKLFYECPHLI